VNLGLRSLPVSPPTLRFGSLTDMSCCSNGNEAPEFVTSPSGPSASRTLCHNSVLAFRRVFAAAAAVVVACALGATGSAAPRRDLSAYQGLGAWLDIWDVASWRGPEQVAASMKAHGVRTLFLETGNSGQLTDLVRPTQLGQLVDAAHAVGLRVVAWYLPSLLSPSRDLRRVLAAVRFTTRSGGHFDSFALDIEASDVRSAQLRNARLAWVAASLRRAVGPTYPLGAIVPSAAGMELHPQFWPRFPYATLARSFDVFLPMAYSTYHAKGRAASAQYVIRSSRLLRAAAGSTVAMHVIGGIAGSASAADVAGFMDAVARCAPVGYSLYDFPLTSQPTWTALASTPPPAGTCSETPVP
jgi:hypothetical protein